MPRTTHGKSGTKTYLAWHVLLKAHRADTDPRWLDFMNFLDDMGEKPDKKSLRRVDHSAPYSKDNCRWMARSEWAVGPFAANFRHGMHFSKTHSSWNRAIQRTTNPRNPDYPDYGGRGITICDKWRTFLGFYEDMGERPEGCTLDRIDCNEGYHPGNCRWASDIEQARNRRNTIRVVFQGASITLPELAEKLGVKYAGLARANREGRLEKFIAERT